MGITMNEVKQHNLIKDSTLKLLGEQCKSCGGKLEFTNNLKKSYCTNTECKGKVIEKIKNMLSILGIVEINSTFIEDIVIELDIKSSYSILEINARNIKLEGKDKFNEQFKTLLDIEEISLPNYVKLSGITNLINIADKLFYGYNSIEEAYIDIEKEQVTLISERLGIKSSSALVLAVYIFNILIKHKDELIYGQQFFNISKNNTDKLKVSIASLAGYINKSEFIEYARRLSKKYTIIHTSLVNEFTNILIIDGNKESDNKYKTALLIKNNEMKIMTSKEFMQYLEGGEELTCIA